MIENYEYDSVKDKSSQDRTGGFWGRAGSDEQAEQDEALVVPTAKEYGSMLHILSKSKDSKRGSNWERSMELLREAQENEFPIAEASFQTGVFLFFFAILWWSARSWVYIRKACIQQ